MRLFTAVELNEEIKNEIVRVASDLKCNGVKVAKREELHITLTFLGDVEEANIDSIIDALKTVKSASFSVKVQGIGTFNPEYIKIVFAKIADGYEGIKGIYRQAAEALDSHGIFFDKKEYLPHITIARVKNLKDKQSLYSFIEKYKNKEFGSFKVDSFSLFKSTLMQSGPEYHTLYKFDL